MNTRMFQTSCVNDLGVQENMFDATRAFRHAYTRAMRETSTFSDKPYFAPRLTHADLPSSRNMTGPTRVEWECSVPVVENGTIVHTIRHLLESRTTYTRSSVQGRCTMMPGTKRIANPVQRLQAMCSEHALLEIHVKEFGWDADPAEWTRPMQAHFETLCHRFPKIMQSWLSCLDQQDVEYSGFRQVASIGVPIVVCLANIVGFQNRSALTMPPEYDAFFHLWCLYSDFDISSMQYQSQLHHNRIEGIYTGAVRWPFFVAPEVGAYVQEQMQLRSLMDLPVSEKMIIESCFSGIPENVLPLPLQSSEIDAMDGHVAS